MADGTTPSKRLVRVPGAARTLRVTLSEEQLSGESEPDTSGNRNAAQAALQTACAAVERLVPALAGIERAQLWQALHAVREGLDVILRSLGLSDEERQDAGDELVRIASIAQGHKTETRPGRRLPWWQAIHKKW
ncbi:MAG: hypothetical protein HY791_27320 [Deltaproteobacteria bacterium]|nr:hypothetical protein [Deltaproteobacteria bacterium]